MRRPLILAGIVLSVGPVPASAYNNGQIPGRALRAINATGPSTRLVRGAAASWNTMRLCSLRQSVDLHTSGDGAYRSLAEQNYRYSLYLNGQGALAAYPGTSNHGFGVAVDLDQPGMRTWIDGHGGSYGWFWGSVPSEWWHILGRDSFARPDPGPVAEYPTLSRGSGGKCQQPFVDEARRRLGLAQGRPFTSGMVGAVRAFQFQSKLHRSGVVDERTWNKLRSITRGPQPTPQPRAQGPDVAAVQGLINARLRELGSRTRAPVNGVFGASTVRALKEFQFRSRLHRTGRVDSATKKALRKPRAATVTPGSNVGKVRPRGPLYAIDVSEHNGNVNWRQVRKHAEAAYIRATWTGNSAGGLHRDALLSDDRCKQARQAGLKIGFYDYDIPVRAHGPTAAAAHFYRAVSSLPHCKLRPGDLAPAHDLEESQLSASATGRWVAGWVREVRRRERAAGLQAVYVQYAGAYWRDSLPNGPRLGPLWLAAYVRSPDPYVPGTWRREGFLLWQYTDSANVAGASNVDESVMYRVDRGLPKLLVRQKGRR